MPRFSVIVPAYKVQAYLQESLESVLTQSYADLELIAVDDASPDACGSIIDDHAARDPPGSRACAWRTTWGWARPATRVWPGPPATT
ncbi:hypothetical protein GCM10020254_51920 [Streptomyces goshikiensis]